MSLAPLALTTVAMVQDELGLGSGDQVAYLQRAINRASQALASRCARSFHYEVDRVERLAGLGSSRLVVGLTPLRSISSIVLELGDVDQTIDASEYEIEESGAGFIRRRRGTWGYTGAFTGALLDPVTDTERLLWAVTYSGGWVTPQQAEDDAELVRDLPYDLEDAVISMVVSMYRSKGRDPRIKSKKLLSGSVSYEVNRGSLTPEAEAVIDTYRERL